MSGRLPRPSSQTKPNGGESNEAEWTTPVEAPAKPAKSPLRAAGQHPLADQQKEEAGWSADPHTESITVNLAPPASELEDTNRSTSASSNTIAASTGGSSSSRPNGSSEQGTISSEASASSPPSLSYLSVDGHGRKRAPSDASTGMQATAHWFSGSVTDDDGSSLASPTELDWPDEASSLLERAKDALASGVAAKLSIAKDESPARESDARIEGKQKPSASAAPQSAQTNTRRSATLPTSSDAASGSFASSEQKLARSASKASGGGILGRLKRISRKEKRASTTLDPIGNRDSFALPSPRVVGENPMSPFIHENTPDQEQDYSKGPSQTHGMQADLPIQDVTRERTPQYASERVHSIHSVQPSLVDDESIAGRDSPGGSPIEIDEEWEEPGATPNIPSEEARNLGGGEGTGSGDEEWHMQSLPGSFIAGTAAHAKEETQTSMRSGIHEASSAVSEGGEGETETPKAHQTPAAEDTHDAYGVMPSILVESPPKHLHDLAQQPSEYTQALSRQPSDYASESSSSQYLEPTQMSGTADEEDDAVTPRATAEPERASYFDAPTPSAGPAPPATAIAGFESMSTATPLNADEAWLEKANLAQEERHYLVRYMVTQQMVWEMERLYLIRRSNDLDNPSPTSALPKSDLGYIKASPGDFVPNLPITRLVVRHILMTCPIFSAAIPIEGAAAGRARAAGAKRFLDEGILPLARFIHSHALSRSVDLNGEWPDEMFDAPATLDVMRSSIFNVLARYVAALVDGRGHGFLWSKIPSAGQASFFAHRTTLSQLKQGGMEVNVVGARFRSASRECEFILSVRRYGFPPAFVIRSESDFYNYARGLAEELGPQVRVRPVPAPDSESLFQPILEDDEFADGRSSSSSPTLDTLRKATSKEQLYKVTGKSNSSSSLHNVSLGAQPMSREPTSYDSVASVRPQPTTLATGESLSHIRMQNKSSISLASVKSARRRSTDGPKSPHSPVGSQRDRSSSRMFSTRSGHRNLSTSDLSTLSLAAPITYNEEARRKQIRAWLRDTLSIRGAGHAKETMSFLLTDSFLDRDLKPGSRRDVQSRLEADDAAMRDRERIIVDAPREVVELRKEMARMWRECVEGDGLERALLAVKQHSTFSTLPLPYQRFISWTNLQVATFLHHTFIDSHEARNNFDRFQELVSVIPWRLLTISLKERTGLMMQKVQGSLTDEFVQKKILAILLEDVPAKKVETELRHLKERLGGTVMRKLEVFVQSPEWQKRVVRRAAKQAEIPLVAAIMRGSDRPLLAADGIKRVVAATRAYKEFMATQPSYTDRKAKLKANVEVRLIYDMQRALRLLSQQRDGRAIRAALTRELKPVIAALVEPLLGLLRRLHRSKTLLGRRPSTTSTGSGSSGDGSQDVVMELQQFCLKLLDVLAGLRRRVQDPWRSLSTLTLLLDDAVPAWYHLLHTSSLADSLLHDFTQWLQSIAALLRFRSSADGSSGVDLLSRFWPKPTVRTSSGTTSTDMPLRNGQPDRAAIEAIVEAAWRKRTRQVETGCRWAAGEADADLDIQLMGEGGKTRTTPYEMPKTKPGPSEKVRSALDRMLPGFRGALERVLAADPGTAW